MTAKTSYSFNWGETQTTTKSEAIAASVKVQPKSQKSVIVSSNRYIMDVPYVATLTKEYYYGSKETINDFKGVYEGVQINQVHVVYGEDTPIS